MMEIPLAEVSTEGAPEAAALKTQGKRVSLGYRRPMWTVKGFGGKIRQRHLRVTEEGKPVNRAGEGATLNGEGSSLLVTDSWNGFFLCLRLYKSDWLFVLTYVAFRNMHFTNINTQFRDVQAATHKFSCQTSESASLVLPCSSWWPADVAAEHSGGVLLVRGSLPSASLFPCGTSNCPSHHCEICQVAKYTLPQPWTGTHLIPHTSTSLQVKAAGKSQCPLGGQLPLSRQRGQVFPECMFAFLLHAQRYTCYGQASSLDMYQIYLGWKLGNHL